MLEVVGASESIVFVSALVLMLGIGALELIGIGGAGADLDVDGDVLSWLGVGRLPFLLLLVVFLAAFGTLGLVAQQASRDLTGALLSPWIAGPAAAIAALPLTGLLARGLARILPTDHTTAIPLDALVGRRGEFGRVVEHAHQRAPVVRRHVASFRDPRVVHLLAKVERPIERRRIVVDELGVGNDGADAVDHARDLLCRLRICGARWPSAWR